MKAIHCPAVVRAPTIVFTTPPCQAKLNQAVADDVIEQGSRMSIYSLIYWSTVDPRDGIVIARFELSTRTAAH